jgi:hypothetical protein
MRGMFVRSLCAQRTAVDLDRLLTIAPSCTLVMPRGGHEDKSVGDEIAAREELENLQRVFSVLVKKEVGKITKEKIFATMKRLKFPNVTMGLVEDLIWEVDEDCDGMLSWDEFKGMFFCVRNDKTGWEPRRLFNLVEVCAALRFVGLSHVPVDVPASVRVQLPLPCPLMNMPPRPKQLCAHFGSDACMRELDSSFDSSFDSSLTVHDVRQGSRRIHRHGRVHGDLLPPLRQT